MRFLYADNFRGFSNTVVPIADVSFLVGENSTGKTSLLAILGILADPQFWFSQTFEVSSASLGHFHDIVSVHSQDRSSFTIGTIKDVPQRMDASKGSDQTSSRKSAEEKAKRTVACLLTFKERSGLPVLSRLTLCEGQAAITIKRTAAKTLFRRWAFGSDCDSRTFVTTRFRRLTKEHFAGSSFKVVKNIPGTTTDQFPIPFVLSFLTSEKEGSVSRMQEWVWGWYTPFDSPLVSLAPIRSTPKRTYDEVHLEFTPEGAHTPYLIRKQLSSRGEAVAFKKSLERVGAESGLFESIKVRLYGKSATAPFELDVVIDQKALSVSSVGYGVSQALPVIVELLVREKRSWFAVQQPEVHLHPRAQAALGELMFELAATEKKRLLVETHSDFLIDRFRLMHGKRRAAKPASQILFFERRGKSNRITTIPIGEDGGLPAEQPSKYRDFFVKEEMKLLGL